MSIKKMAERLLAADNEYPLRDDEIIAKHYLRAVELLRECNKQLHYATSFDLDIDKQVTEFLKEAEGEEGECHGE